MAAKTKTPVTTGGTAFTGTEYQQYLDIRREAMAGFADGTVDATAKNLARAVVRNARKAITATGMTVDEWREAERVREAEVAAAKTRKPRSAKKAATPAPAEAETVTPENESGSEPEVAIAA